MAITLDHLPPEILEQIFLELHPRYVASLAQTCNLLHAEIYNPLDQRLWRMLYLLMPLDDLRLCRNSLGDPLPQEVDWKSAVQRVVRAQTVLSDSSKCRPGERLTILQTLIDLVCNLPTAPTFWDVQPTNNLAWLVALLRNSKVFEYNREDVTDEEHQLYSRLHTYFGLTARDYQPARRTTSRGFVYAMRHYRRENGYGPLLMDGSGRVNWEHVQAIHHVMSMQIVPPREETELGQSLFTIYPMSLPYCQSVIPEGVDLGRERDWAGVEGSWQCSFCFCDHRELLVYNNYNLLNFGPLQTGIFDDPDFVEIFRTINIDIRVISTKADSSHPTRPVIHFSGTAHGNTMMVGEVKLTPDNQIRWHFKSGEGGQAVWSSEGIQVGNVRSSFGVLGAWTTTEHDTHDPVGPFWLRKVPPTVSSIPITSL
ncbi:hypothetical protein WOLCODRAFT_66963 [Wolfiporia cocos MD-104 SS10]|uniref:F-box domain-containing protein n=1 Tax=Wolfiporia cocos (strain MD-104) TaxID=742152 RepID=A0A2H3JC65_WOLCO|nr:hypothetical protein WOLCODRAFT_66963 [Wolfiporia cocos MD-104 SS10]